LFWSSIGFGDKGEEDKTVAFLSALDEEHRRWDKIELRVVLFCGLFV
jgi:hypothetical protein